MTAAPNPSPRQRRWRRALLIGLLLALLGLIAYGVLYPRLRRTVSDVIHRPRNTAIDRWFSDASSRAALATRFDAPCPGYPFLVPSAGLVGGLPWNAAYGPYTIFNPHPGIDIFTLEAEGTAPVRAAYDGWLTRESNWTSAVIIRHDDPLHPGQTIWTYYTHMANLSGSESYIVADFSRGSFDVPVRQGDLLGYQGVYNGGVDAARIGLHLHFSIVKSDLRGDYLNEAVFDNTLDPSPYLGLNLNDPPSEAFPLRCLDPAADLSAE